MGLERLRILVSAMGPGTNSRGYRRMTVMLDSDKCSWKCKLGGGIRGVGVEHLTGEGRLILPGEEI